MSTQTNPVAAAPLHRRQLSQRYQSSQSGVGRMIAVLAGTAVVLGGAIAAMVMI